VMISRKLYLLLFFVILVSFSQAAGILEPGISQIYEISGKVRLVGNEPFSQMVITDLNGKDYIISKEYYSTFKKFIHTKVTVASKIKEEELHSADGKYTINIKDYATDGNSIQVRAFYDGKYKQDSFLLVLQNHLIPGFLQ